MKKKILLTFFCMLLFSTSVSFLVNANNISTTFYDNNPPNPPIVEGPTSGSIDEYYTYSITVSDPDYDDLLLKIEIDWGDGTTNQICGSCTTQPWQSGDTEEVEYRWSKEGTYSVTARVQDEYALWGEWSEPLVVTMPKAKTNLFSLIQMIRDLLPNLYNIR